MTPSPDRRAIGEPLLENLARIREGDREAFRPLVERYTPMLLALAARYAAEADREDLVQAMWLHVYNKIGLYDPRRGALGPWIWVTAWNVARQYGRREARRATLARAAAAEQTAIQTLENPDEDAIIERERDRRLYEAIGKLPRLQRDALWLRYFEGLSVAETARGLGRAEGTVKTSVARAIEKLRKALEVLYED